MKRCLCLTTVFLLLMTAAPALLAQEDALDLPSALYVLTNDGMVQRYGRGVEGISTVTPEGEFVLDFGAAPDDLWLAYRTEQALMVANRETGERVQLAAGAPDQVPSVRGAGDTVAWSPTGDALAVTTLYGGRIYFSPDGSLLTAPEGMTSSDLFEGAFVQLSWSPGGRFLAAEVDGHIWWIYRREGQSMILTSAITSSIGLAWASPAELVFAPAEGGLFVMNLEQGNQQTQLLDATSTYRMPQVLPGGVIAVFSREQETELEPDLARLDKLTVSSGALEALAENPLNLQGLRWAPWGELMTSLQEGVFGLLIPASGQSFVLPISGAVSYAWGPPPSE